MLTRYYVHSLRVHIAIDETSASKLVWPKSFNLALEKLPQSRLRVRGPHGRVLYGSSLNPWGTIQSGVVSTRRIAQRFPAIGEAHIQEGDIGAEISVPARHFGAQVFSAPQNCFRDVLVVIPVYLGYDTTIACINSVVAHKSSREEILVISDSSPDPKLVRELKNLAKNKYITLLLEENNRGFPGTANIGLRRGASAGQDVILLNSDTLVTAGWVSKLSQAAYKESNIGTATPLSNAATILSYPYQNQQNEIPTLDGVKELSCICEAVNENAVVDIPTAHGFCMYIKHDCLVETGVLREETFAQGYGEENDFSMRARHLGWRHVAVPGLYIGHIEGQSFASAKESLILRNLAILNVLHPGYDAVIAEWQKKDPLAEYRRRIDIQRWTIHQGARPVICFLTHDREGGVLRHVQMRAIKSERDGFCSIICKPKVGNDNAVYCEVTSPSAEFPNLKFRADTELQTLRSFLTQIGLSSVEVHHFIGHDPSVISLVCNLGAPYDVHVHDYSWFCPRITLTSLDNRYCGEPPISGCVQCVSELGSNLGCSISPHDLVSQSRVIFSGARHIIAPSVDAARRFESRFAIAATVTPWEDSAKPLKFRSIPRLHGDATRKVCIVGAIGYEKGYDVILSCARLAAQRGLPLEFVIVGFTCDDERLRQTGKVKITGRYEDSEAVRLIKAQNAHFGFLPSLWPETWSYVLSQMWEAELPVVAFDIGTPSERIKARAGGVVLPLGFPIDKLVQWLLAPG